MKTLKHWVCSDASHSCGQMLKQRGVKQGIFPRCEVYQEVLDRIAISQPACYPYWYKVFGDHGSRRPSCERSSCAFARPRNLIVNEILVEVPQDPKTQHIPYIAISYTWDQNPAFVTWEGRPVTTQALALARRLADLTSHALWIDAICIPQDDEEVKQQELPKMADIYRGAEAVVCLFDGIDSTACEAVRCAVQLMETDEYGDMADAGDIYGCFLFATGGGSDIFSRIFEHRWWERAWTFQEAVLNPKTYLIGKADDTIPISDLLKIVSAVRRRVASVPGRDSVQFGRASAFWDSVSAMTVAAERTLSLSEAIACVWRRDAKEKHDLVYSIVGVCGLSNLVKPRYRTPFDAVLLELFRAAVSCGDYTWLTWSAVTDSRNFHEVGMSLIPIPEVLRRTAFTSITSWRNMSLPPAIPQLGDGAGVGVTLPYRSTGIIRSVSAPRDFPGTVTYLKELGHPYADIWDMLFGARVGLMHDIIQAVGQIDIAVPAVNLAVMMHSEGRVYADGSWLADMSGERPFTAGITFASYAVMAADSWTQSSVSDIVVVSSQGGTVVVPAECGVSVGGRLYVLPIEPSRAGSEGRMFAFVTSSIALFDVCATAVMIANAASAGRGSWQRRTIG
ncbi:heterokaryon incompatibility protein-domain-containing protein [Fomes fomentarius]|nr:heterokaryon incompatibility protein-domain-containing protein [Fomes fomentarius]